MPSFFNGIKMRLPVRLLQPQPLTTTTTTIIATAVVATTTTTLPSPTQLLLLLLRMWMGVGVASISPSTLQTSVSRCSYSSYSPLSSPPPYSLPICRSLLPPSFCLFLLFPFLHLLSPRYQHHQLHHRHCYYHCR